MSTRGFYQFHDENPEQWESKLGDINVYRQSDNYPTGAVYAIEQALTNAWDLPRFEADEFAAAFISANKDHQGNLRVFKSGSWQDVAPPDVEYIYIITTVNGGLHIKCLEPGKKLFSGSLDKFKAWAIKND